MTWFILLFSDRPLGSYTIICFVPHCLISHFFIHRIRILHFIILFELKHINMIPCLHSYRVVIHLLVSYIFSTLFSGESSASIQIT